MATPRVFGAGLSGFGPPTFSLSLFGVGWLSFADAGVTEEEIVLRESNGTDCYRLRPCCRWRGSNNMLTRIEGAGQMARFVLTSGRWELIIVFGVLSMVLQVLSGPKLCHASGTELADGSRSVATPLSQERWGARTFW